MDRCCNCGCSLKGTPTGESGVYNPDYSEANFILCEPCFFLEDEMIESRRTNDLPERLAHYRRGLG